MVLPGIPGIPFNPRLPWLNQDYGSKISVGFRGSSLQPFWQPSGPSSRHPRLKHDFDNCGKIRERRRLPRMESSSVRLLSREATSIVGGISKNP
jgi:hypothetical protein